MIVDLAAFIGVFACGFLAGAAYMRWHLWREAYDAGYNDGLEGEREAPGR